MFLCGAFGDRRSAKLYEGFLTTKNPERETLVVIFEISQLFLTSQHKLTASMKQGRDEICTPLEATAVELADVDVVICLQAYLGPKTKLRSPFVVFTMSLPSRSLENWYCNSG